MHNFLKLQSYLKTNVSNAVNSVQVILYTKLWYYNFFFFNPHPLIGQEFVNGRLAAGEMGNGVQLDNMVPKVCCIILFCPKIDFVDGYR
jgi:hypothetical protein